MIPDPGSDAYQTISKIHPALQLCWFEYVTDNVKLELKY